MSGTDTTAGTVVESQAWRAGGGGWGYSKQLSLFAWSRSAGASLKEDHSQLSLTKQGRLPASAWTEQKKFLFI